MALVIILFPGLFVFVDYKSLMHPSPMAFPATHPDPLGQYSSWTIHITLLCCRCKLIKSLTASGKPHGMGFFSFFFLIGFIMVTLVNKIIRVSGAQFHNTSSVHCIVCSPPQVKGMSFFPESEYKAWI